MTSSSESVTPESDAWVDDVVLTPESEETLEFLCLSHMTCRTMSSRSLDLYVNPHKVLIFHANYVLTCKFSDLDNKIYMWYNLKIQELMTHKKGRTTSTKEGLHPHRSWEELGRRSIIYEKNHWMQYNGDSSISWFRATCQKLCFVKDRFFRKFAITYHLRNNSLKSVVHALTIRS